MLGGSRAVIDLAIAGAMCHILYSQCQFDLTQRFVDNNSWSVHAIWHFINTYRFSSLVKILMHYNLTTGLFTRYVRATVYLKFKVKEPTRQRICNTLCRGGLFPHFHHFSQLMFEMSLGTVSSNAIKYDLYCYLFRAWKEYVFDFMSPLRPLINILSSLRELSVSSVRLEHLTLLAFVRPTAFSLQSE